MTYEDFKFLTRRTASDKLLCNKVFNIAKKTKYDGGYQRGLASMSIIFFDKKSSDYLAAILKMKLFLIKN